jgi:hypothetical protein
VIAHAPTVHHTSSAVIASEATRSSRVIGGIGEAGAMARKAGMAHARVIPHGTSNLSP